MRPAHLQRFWRVRANRYCTYQVRTSTVLYIRTADAAALRYPNTVHGPGPFRSWPIIRSISIATTWIKLFCFIITAFSTFKATVRSDMVKQTQTLPKKKTECGESNSMMIHPAYDVFREWMLERKRRHSLARIIVKEREAYYNTRDWDRIKRMFPWVPTWEERKDKVKELAESYERRIRSGFRSDEEWWSKNIGETDWEQPCSCLTCNLLRKLERQDQWTSFESRLKLVTESGCTEALWKEYSGT
jgi:hypothetical protein